MATLITQDNHQLSLSDKKFREVICRILMEIKESISSTEKTKNIEIRKTQTEITGLKS